MDATMLRREEHRTRGERLVERVRELIREGNVRRITIRNEEGRTLVEIPLTLGVVGALLAPSLAAIGAIAAVVTECAIEVERDETAPELHSDAAVVEHPVGIEHEIDTEC